jgi:uncharacterized membrane protein
LEPILADLSRVQREQIVGKVTQVVATQAFSGPLPPPHYLQQYDSIVAGGAERIFAMAEITQKHNRDMEAAIVRCEIRDRHLGMLLGFISLMAIIGLAAYAGVRGNNILAGLLLTASVIGTVVAFVKGRG